MLKAVGKFIDTLPLEKLLSQGEHFADTVTIRIDRYYGTHDMTKFVFIMRGITESGGETETVLENSASDGDVIYLQWKIGKNFTTESGLLALDMLACHYEEDADPTEDEPDVIIRYQLPPVRIRALPETNHTIDAQSHIDFLLQVQNEIENQLTEINAIVEQFRSDLSVTQLDERLETLEISESQLSDKIETLQKTVDAGTV